MRHVFVVLATRKQRNWCYFTLFITQKHHISLETQASMQWKHAFQASDTMQCVPPVSVCAVRVCVSRVCVCACCVCVCASAQYLSSCTLGMCIQSGRAFARWRAGCLCPRCVWVKLFADKFLERWCALRFQVVHTKQFFLWRTSLFSKGFRHLIDTLVSGHVFGW